MILIGQLVSQHCQANSPHSFPVEAVKWSLRMDHLFWTNRVSGKEQGLGALTTLPAVHRHAGEEGQLLVI